ncbi:hypothetical protein [Burkholderia catarinensis]|uniref:hypothetical protein n=1 Tax=Burkholderia catarinensis TaxID=1108140 RepID=UPI000918FBB8|nr:hypothetical protein [Burkholderia catarinensis]KAG8150170.1 hypothetical protein BFF94_028180 [Burkholderia catarinensis]
MNDFVEHITMIELDHERSGFALVFDANAGQRLLMAIGAWDDHASLSMEVFDRRAERVIEVQFCFGCDDCIEFRAKGIVITLSRDASDYASHKLEELIQKNGFSTPEFWQFNHPKKRKTTIDTFLVLKTD